MVKLTRLVGDCDEGECPTLYATDRGTLVVQGELLTGHGREIPLTKPSSKSPWT